MYEMSLLHYLVFLGVFLFVTDVSSNETGKKGPKVTDKVSLLFK
jgi:hypothetical protein